ncbi:hypothetical protein BDV39DRAFT_209162 [Aspergillus sergii]|uniref:CN hydrolase domain-containing protein n=1 Tax=Aspergillus sergii TaxID=1034303 RepID=A0A5N6WT36_9EURO|nr:hypothetical protein BDV39DRAFT_209162 [Aspergillus sergii]
MKISYTILLPAVLYQAGQAVGLTCTPDAFPSINGSAFKLAAVQDPPVNFALPEGFNMTSMDLDLHGTIAQAIEIIQEIKTEGVSLIAFPELYCPGYPVKNLHFDEDGEESLAAARWYSANIGGTVLIPAVGSAAIYINGGKMANITNTMANPSWRYVTTTIDTTQFSNTTFDISGEYSWAALKQIIENHPSYIPKVASSFFDKKTINIQNITS